ncbi:MAG: aspartate aminotransferase family protein [Pirellulales bacterium]
MTRTSAQRSRAVFPAGSNGEFNLPAEFSTVIERGEGCELWTAGGQRMLDFSMGWGSALVGHGRREVADAVAAQVRRGMNFAYVTEQSLALAEEIVRLSPACESVRFCASGTEATMYCLRLARAFTGRPKVLKFEGAYHGAHDVGVCSLFPTADTPVCRPTSSSAGVAPSAEADTLVAPFNDLAVARELITRHADQLAAVIVEPLQRCVTPEPGFLAGLRELTRSSGVLLAFDEVVTGFRLAYGGAQEYYGVVPDLVAYGKALGGGLPIGAFGGAREIMELVREDRMGRDTYVWTASTLGGNPVSSAAASAALDIFREETCYATLHHLGRYLRAGIERVLADFDLAARVLGDGPLAQIAFTTAEVRDYRSSQHQHAPFARRLMLELFSRGIFLNPMGTKLYLSLAHDEAACDEFCVTLAAALESVTNDRSAEVRGAI